MYQRIPRIIKSFRLQKKISTMTLEKYRILENSRWSQMKKQRKKRKENNMPWIDDLKKKRYEIYKNSKEFWSFLENYQSSIMDLL